MLFQRASLSCRLPYSDQWRRNSVLSWPSISFKGLGVKPAFPKDCARMSEYTYTSGTLLPSKETETRGVVRPNEKIRLVMNG